MRNRKNVVVLGGGTGTATVLRSLKKYPVNLIAIPSMADDGGSTGVLRRELGVLPAGDVRQCLIALADEKTRSEKLLAHRFGAGAFAGHNVGNLVFAALEQEYGSFAKALDHCATLFHIQGTIHPATFTPITLVAHFEQETIRGESAIHAKNLVGLKNMTLDPLPRVNPKAIKALRAADTIIFAPGDWCCSVMPNLLIPGIKNTINASTALKIQICNLMTTKNHTDGWSVRTFREKLETLLQDTVDYTVCNSKIPKGKAAVSYAAAGREFVKIDNDLDTCYVLANVLSPILVKPSKKDFFQRNPVRHDEHALARVLISLVNKSHDKVHRY
ncbi:MAG: hypothetical protein G01um101448_1060 [Parcubacteria group bacterium Gr01-1014_48]|nr:MAG: hypothetical protein Greene041614_617 [Parcubacteria group bacterium Greene0416_14]TSC71994.1 MAG: hypothetical protein G01um101448_1060 [Parcubacteria group bacterium Gr01-1014_48]TSD00865.1 MAG: hypothetical protein Greene101415_666 [Parcubacteria group bacterium Greene1014_15]TSD07947.1 MAG: hypothetical protein Greene07144_577 [Parcubacteria group bacterium Greene0714_4]